MPEPLAGSVRATDFAGPDPSVAPEPGTPDEPGEQLVEPEPGTAQEPGEPLAAPEPATALELAPEPNDSQPIAAEPLAPAQPSAAEVDPFEGWGPPGSDPLTPIGPLFQAAALLGVGAAFADTPGSVNPLGFGFGLRGNYRLLPQLVVGGRFMYFVGGSAALATGEVSLSSWLLAAEVAYPVRVARFIVEPGLALGLSARSVDGREALLDGGNGYVPRSADRTSVSFYVAPGAAIVLPLALATPDLELFFVGGDARIGLYFGSELSSSLELLAQAGLRF